jgi:hypothetical protein
MTKRKVFHLTVGGTTYCDWLGCMAGQGKAAQSGVYSCSHTGARAAQEAAKALQPYFKAPVRAVAGECPTMKESR